ncbi:hypothetical protein [Streptomyces sp. x-80]|uniref:hypothetical protein n=1 Tax=Streptomyces sp. x-80 TaxID=2789282 RepID=UPI00397EB6B6
MTRRRLIPEVWYCKYCYRRRRIGVGPDGSLIVCTVCGYGLAPLEDVIAAGSMRTWYEGICDAFYSKLESDYEPHGRPRQGPEQDPSQR